MGESVIYTDGACSGNPGPGGWGAVLRYGDTKKELHGGDPATTNNRMELMAAIQALESLTRPVDVHMYTDSKYVLDGITKWLPGWQRNGWKTASTRRGNGPAPGAVDLGQGAQRRPRQRAGRRARPPGHLGGHPALARGDPMKHGQAVHGTDSLAGGGR